MAIVARLNSRLTPADAIPTTVPKASWLKPPRARPASAASPATPSVAIGTPKVSWV
jgi:hypothetical protein